MLAPVIASDSLLAVSEHLTAWNVPSPHSGGSLSALPLQHSWLSSDSWPLHASREEWATTALGGEVARQSLGNGWESQHLSELPGPGPSSSRTSAAQISFLSRSDGVMQKAVA